MKVRIEYTLPREEYAYKNAMNGSDYFGVLVELDSWLRNLIKYDETQSSEKIEAFSECRKQLNECMEDRGLTLYV